MLTSSKRIFQVVIFITLSIFFIGCGKEEKPKKEGTPTTLLIYGPDNMKWINDEIHDEFLKDTGIDINFVSIDGLLSRMKLEKVSPKADVVLGLTMSDIIIGKKEDLFFQYKPKGTHFIAKKEFISDPDWYVTPFDYGSLGINYDTTKVEGMSSFKDIVEGDKKIIIESPYSYTGREFMLWSIALYGEDHWLDFWKSLKGNIHITASGWSDAFSKFTSGEAPLMAGYSTSDIFFNQEKGNKLKSFIPSEGGYIYLESAAIVNKPNVKNDAKRFIDYLLTDKYQKLIASKNYMFPVTSVEMPKEYMDVPKLDKIVTLNSDITIEKISKWQEELMDLLKEK